MKILLLLRLFLSSLPPRLSGSFVLLPALPENTSLRCFPYTHFEKQKMFCRTNFFQSITTKAFFM